MPASRDAEAERDTPSRSHVVAATATQTSQQTSSCQASLFMPASRDAEAERDTPSGAKLVIKEEGDTSQVSQAYDQLVAKLDKKYSREMLVVVNKALNEVAMTQAWKQSFIRVNMCPSEALVGITGEGEDQGEWDVDAVEPFV